MQEDTFTHTIDEVEITSAPYGVSRRIGFGTFQLEIHYIKQQGEDVWWEVSDVRDEFGVSFGSGMNDPFGALIISHAKSIATENDSIRDAIDLEVSYRLTPEDPNAEHRLRISEVV